MYWLSLALGVSRGSPRLHIIYPLVVVCLCIYLYAVTKINTVHSFTMSHDRLLKVDTEIS